MNVVNRWVDTLILNIKGQMPDGLADKLPQHQKSNREPAAKFLS